MAKSLHGRSREAARPLVGHEPLDVAGLVGRGLVAVAARHPGQHEAPLLGRVLVGQGVAEVFGLGRGAADDGAQHFGGDRLDRHHQDGLKPPQPGRRPRQPPPRAARSSPSTADAA